MRRPRRYRRDRERHRDRADHGVGVGDGGGGGGARLAVAEIPAVVGDRAVGIRGSGRIERDRASDDGSGGCRKRGAREPDGDSHRLLGRIGVAAVVDHGQRHGLAPALIVGMRRHCVGRGLRLAIAEVPLVARDRPVGIGRSGPVEARGLSLADRGGCGEGRAGRTIDDRRRPAGSGRPAPSSSVTVRVMVFGPLRLYV